MRTCPARLSYTLSIPITTRNHRRQSIGEANVYLRLEHFLQSAPYLQLLIQRCWQLLQLSASSSPLQQPYAVNQTVAATSLNALLNPWFNP